MTTHVLPMARPRIRRLFRDFVLTMGDFEIILDDGQIDELVTQLRDLGTIEEEGPECVCDCQWCRRCLTYGAGAS